MFSSHSLVFSCPYKIDLDPVLECFYQLFPPPLPPPSIPPFLKEGRRREPCVVCRLPVFLAQRLIVSGRLYHRTCFRCARCSSQLTLANCYETQNGAFCCETCPDEETMPQPPDIGDKGGGYADDATLYIPTQTPTLADKTDPDPLVTSRSASLVGLRRMMFENISVANTKTDDEKLPFHKTKQLTDLDLAECDKSDVSDKPKISDSSVVLVVKDKCSYRLSDSRSDDKSDVSVDKSSRVAKSDFLVNESVLGKSEFSSDDIRPEIVVTQNSSNKESKLDGTKELSTLNKTTEEFSSLNTNDINIVETENKILIHSQSTLDVDSDLELDSSSSDIPIVQAKNKLINQPDDEIEYKALTESKESLDDKVVEAKNSGFVDSDYKDSKSFHSETESLLSHAESGSLKEPEEGLAKNEDEFTSLTHNIEQLVVEANNESVTKESNEKEILPEPKVETENEDVRTPKVPTPTKRVIKHKPPIPENRKAQEIAEQKNQSTNPADEYPDELNPFDDDDDEGEVDRKEKPEEKRKQSAVSLNPFGSSDEEEEVKTPIRKSEDVPKPATRKVIPAPKINLNPFWSGDEEEDDEESLPPVPKPRKSQPSPEPSPGPRRLRSATGSIGSATSLASRKKTKAPLPPNWQGGGTISRKSYLAPKPPTPRTVTPSPPPLPDSSPPSSLFPHEKDDKEFLNRQRKSSIVSETSSIGTISSYTPHKSMYGQWKRKKGPAPARPVPVRRAVEPMPLASVRQELDDIEIKQQGLERQGVKLEQTIRDKFEQDGASLTPFVEEMVLQLFELVNEKNELFRRQAELMYLRRQHSLEEEHAELEYQIRCLMLCPEANKTDSDKAREEQLIQRLVEVVEKRNEIINCLEMDRLREKEEDRSVGTQLGIFSAAVGSEMDLRAKTERKTKKTDKKKRLSRKDSERSGIEEVTEEREIGEKKKKKKWFTLHHSSKS